MATSLRVIQAPPDGRSEVGAGPEYSIIVPIYNEEENIPLLYSALKPVVDSMDKPCEIILVDDGSQDGSYRELQKIRDRDPDVRVIRFRRNFGQTAAMVAGFTHARGDVIVTLDGDMQNDPRDIPTLLSKIEEGYDVVSGWRVRRKDKFLTRRLPSICANWLISRITGVRLHDYGCTLKAYRKEVAQNIGLYGEMHRFIPAMASWMGVSVAEIEVNHLPRTRGKSKYGLSRTLRVMIDLIGVKFLLRYSTQPLRVFGTIGFVSTAIGLAIGAYLTIQKLIFDTGIAGRPLLFLSVLLTLGGIQFITMGLLGEMLVRIYHEGRGKTTYVIKDMLE